MEKTTYGWSPLSQWDSPPKDAYIVSKQVQTSLSKEICRFMLVTRTDTGGGYMRCQHVPSDHVTPDILELAGRY